MFPLYPKKYPTPTLNMFFRSHTKFCINLFLCSKCELPSKLNFSNDWLSLLQNHICVEFKPIYDPRPLPYLKNSFKKLDILFRSCGMRKKLYWYLVLSPHHYTNWTSNWGQLSVKALEFNIFVWESYHVKDRKQQEKIVECFVDCLQQIFVRNPLLREGVQKKMSLLVVFYY